MRKKDLRLGEIYADNYGQPVLLVHDGVWSKQRHGQKWLLHPSYAKQQRGEAWITTDKGVLIVHGPAEDLKQIKVPEIHVFEQTRNYISEFFTKTLAEFEDTLPPGCHLTVGFSRTWKGPFKEVEAAETAAFEDREKRRAKAQWVVGRRRLRLSGIKQALNGLGMRAHGTTMSRIGEGDLHVSGYDGVTLSLADIEELLELDHGHLLDPGE